MYCCVFNAKLLSELATLLRYIHTACLVNKCTAIQCVML